MFLPLPAVYTARRPGCRRACLGVPCPAVTSFTWRPRHMAFNHRAPRACRLPALSLQLPPIAPSWRRWAGPAPSSFVGFRLRVPAAQCAAVSPLSPPREAPVSPAFVPQLMGTGLLQEPRASARCPRGPHCLGTVGRNGCHRNACLAAGRLSCAPRLSSLNSKFWAAHGHRQGMTLSPTPSAPPGPEQTPPLGHSPGQHHPRSPLRWCAVIRLWPRRRQCPEHSPPSSSWSSWSLLSHHCHFSGRRAARQLWYLLSWPLTACSHSCRSSLRVCLGDASRTP